MLIKVTFAKREGQRCECREGNSRTLKLRANLAEALAGRFLTLVTERQEYYWVK